MVVISAEENDDYKALIYKELKNREWYWVLQLADVLNSDDLTIEILEADYEDINSLCNLDITNTVRCGKHVKNCALQNVFKIYNWWSQC